MKNPLFLALLVVGGLMLMIQAASAATIKPRPIPIITPPTPVGQPTVSAS